MHAALLALSLMLQPADRTVVLESLFVSVLRTPQGEIVRETRQIPYFPGESCFSWVLMIEPQERERQLGEVLQLPAPGTQFGGDTDVEVEVSDDRTRARVEHNLKPGESEVGGSWCIAPGDPLGEYQIIVSDGPNVIHRFDFNVIAGEIAPVT